MRSKDFPHPTEDKWACYGKDHACGWFVQIWTEIEENEPIFFVDADQMEWSTPRLSGPSDVIKILSEHGFDEAARDVVGI